MFNLQCYYKYKLGRYDLNDVLPICDNCGQEIHLEMPHDVIREQYWPGNPAQKSAHIFDTDLFLFYDLLKKHNPGLSEVGFLRTLEQFSLSKGRVSATMLSHGLLIMFYRSDH